MFKAAAVVAFLIGFAAFLAYRFITRHARRGWAAARRTVDAINGEGGVEVSDKPSGGTKVEYQADLHYHAHDD